MRRFLGITVMVGSPGYTFTWNRKTQNILHHLLYLNRKEDKNMKLYLCAFAQIINDTQESKTKPLLVPASMDGDRMVCIGTKKKQEDFQWIPFIKNYFTLLLKDVIYLFSDSGREGERKRNINVWLPLTHPLPGTWPATQACALDWELNQWPFGSQAGAHSTEPEQPGPKNAYLN